MPLSRSVYEALLKRLLSNELRPGDFLNRRSVADEMGVSIAPVREAFQQLEHEGFLASRSRVGTVVRPVVWDDVRGRLMLREAIESQAARLYCGAPIRKHRRRLEELAQHVDRQHFSTSAQWQAEIELHRALVELAQCPLLLKAFDEVMRHSLFYAVNFLLPAPQGDEDMNSFRRNHMLLIDVLTTGNANDAALFAYEHVHRRLELAQQNPASPFYQHPNRTTTGTDESSATAASRAFVR